MPLDFEHRDLAPWTDFTLPSGERSGTYPTLILHLLKGDDNLQKMQDLPSEDAGQEETKRGHLAVFARGISFRGGRTLLPEVSGFSAKQTELGHPQGVCPWESARSTGDSVCRA